MPLWQLIARLGAAPLAVASAYFTYADRRVLAAALAAASLAVAAWPKRRSELTRRQLRIVIAVFGAIVVGVFCTWAGRLVQASTVIVDGTTYYALFDDSMISMRYAWNLAHGKGLVWNPGERVEGFTNPLMVVAMAIASAIFNKVGAVLAIHLFGMATVVANAILLAAVARVGFSKLERPESVVLSAVAGLVGLLYYPLAFWSTFGMETGLLAALVTLGVWLVARPSSADVSYHFALVVAMIVWTRPDAAVPAAILCVARAAPRALRRTALIEIGIAAGIVLIGVLGRRVYYGEWVPNTYVLKMTGLAMDVRLASGWGYVKQFLEQTWPAFVVGWLSILVVRDRLQLLLLSLITGVVLYQAWVGGDPWLYWRILCPYVPLLLLACMRAVVALLSWRHLEGYSLGLALPMLSLCLFMGNRPFMKQIFLDEVPYGSTSGKRNIQTALKLKRFCSPEAKAAVIWAGTILYYSGVRGVDILGKSDKHIARLTADPTFAGNGMKSMPGHNKYDLNYSIRELRPDYVEITRWGRDNVEPFVHQHYVKVEGLWLLRDSPHIRWERVRR